MLSITMVSVSSCSQPPAYEEVEERFIALVEASYTVNKILFGEGLPTYAREYEPTDSVFITEGENGKKVYTYYHYLEDEELGKVLSYKKGYTGSARQYLLVLTTADETKGEAVYFDAEKGEYYYTLSNYKEKTPEFPYSQSDPETYDFVRLDCGYVTIDDIKTVAEKVYSKDYLESSVYDALFTGAVTDEDLKGLSARYIEYGEGADGDVYLMKSNEYEPLITETRKFDFSTARVVKPGNKSLVNIEVETYLESNPEYRLTLRITMVRQDGEWYLDNATY